MKVCNDNISSTYFAFQIRGWVEEQTQTLDFSIGKNSSEGKTHMMCIEGTAGTWIWLGLQCVCVCFKEWKKI